MRTLTSLRGVFFTTKQSQQNLSFFERLLRFARNDAKRYAVIVMLFFLASGCQTAGKSKPQSEDVSAMTTMTQGLTNQPITEENLKNLAKQVGKDPQAQSALKSINTALSAQHTVKYCPVDGQRFSTDVGDCPVHRVQLKWVE